MDLDSEAKKKLQKRAERARQKARKGLPLSERETSAIAEWRAIKSPTGRKPKEIPSQVGLSEPHSKRETTEAGETDRAVNPETEPSPPSPTAAADSPIPKVLGTALPAKGAAVKDWREQYRITGMGREATCVQVAALTCGLLERANKVTKELGYTPLIDDEMLQLRVNPDGSRTVGMVYAALVLCTDSLLPASMELSPEMVAGGCAGVCVGQTFYAKRKGAAAKPELKSVPAPIPFTAPPTPAAPVVEETAPPTPEQLISRVGPENGVRPPPGQNF
jgi:hypothetical protein